MNLNTEKRVFFVCVYVCVCKTGQFWVSFFFSNIYLPHSYFLYVYIYIYKRIHLTFLST